MSHVQNHMCNSEKNDINRKFLACTGLIRIFHGQNVTFKTIIVYLPAWFSWCRPLNNVKSCENESTTQMKQHQLDRTQLMCDFASGSSEKYTAGPLLKQKILCKEGCLTKSTKTVNIRWIECQHFLNTTLEPDAEGGHFIHIVRSQAST